MASQLLRQESASLTSMMDEVGKLDKLDTETEQRLAKIIANSPKDDSGAPLSGEAAAAVDALILHNMKFAVSQAKRFGEVGVPLDDLVSAAAMGLYAAAIRFQPGRSTRFISYAALYVKSHVQREVAYTSGPISHPVNAMSNLASLLRYKEKLAKEGRDETEIDPRDYAEFARLGMGEARAVMSFANRLRFKRESASVEDDKPRNFEPWDIPGMSVDADHAEAEAKKIDSIRLVRTLLPCLTHSQRRAVEGVYLMDMMPADIAKAEGCSRQAIDARLRKAMENMRRYHTRLVAMKKIEA